MRHPLRYLPPRDSTPTSPIMQAIMSPIRCPVELTIYGAKRGATRRLITTIGHGASHSYSHSGETLFDTAAFTMRDFWVKLRRFNIFPIFYLISSENPHIKSESFSTLKGLSKAIETFPILPTSLPPPPHIPRNDKIISANQALELVEEMDEIITAANIMWQNHQPKDK